MFTNIAVDKAVKLVEDNRMGNYEYKKQLVKVIKECVQQNYFRFKDRFYIQEEGLPMGSSLSPILADIYIYIYIYMNDFEKRLLNCTRYKGNIKLWVRYVDDILVIWEGSIEEKELFVKEVNTKEKIYSSRKKLVIRI